MTANTGDHRHKAGDDVAGNTEPVDNVLTLFLTGEGSLAISLPYPRPTRGALREALQASGRGAGLPSGRRSRRSGRPLADLCSSKSKRLKIPRARRRQALPLSHSHRAGRRLVRSLDPCRLEAIRRPGLKVLALGHPTAEHMPRHPPLPRHGRPCAGHPRLQSGLASLPPHPEVQP